MDASYDNGSEDDGLARFKREYEGFDGYDGNISLRKRLSSDLIKILHNDSFNDVCIKLYDGEVLANKVVLSARSDSFAASLDGRKTTKP